jgi:hypothetical protein
MSRNRDLAFARVASNLLLGGTTVGALIALMRIWSREREERGRR